MTNTTFSYEIVCNTLYELLFYLRYFDCHYFFLSVNCGMPAAPDNGSIVTVPSTLDVTQGLSQLAIGQQRVHQMEYH